MKVMQAPHDWATARSLEQMYEFNHLLPRKTVWTGVYQDISSMDAGFPTIEQSKKGNMRDKQY